MSRCVRSHITCVLGCVPLPALRPLSDLSVVPLCMAVFTSLSAMRFASFMPLMRLTASLEKEEAQQSQGGKEERSESDTEERHCGG